MSDCNQRRPRTLRHRDLHQHLDAIHRRRTSYPLRCLTLAISALLAITVQFQGIRACEDLDHQHGLKPRSSSYATQPTTSHDLLSSLTWGDVQIVATTDIHGWYQGHLHSTQPDPNYSGDWGDFASFVTHLRNLAAKRGIDLLVVDSGDLHDGNGLSDGFPEGDVDGRVSNQIHSQISYDLLTVGNHELYKYGVAYDTYRNFIPAQMGRYISSNVNISIYDEGLGHNRSHIMGDRYVKFNTTQGRRVTSLGVLFEFTGQDQGITIQTPADMIKEEWFLQAIQERPDLFLLAGHMPVRGDSWPMVVNAIRKVHKETPIVISGGHTHIRDCFVYDDNAIGIEAGRYLETIGWLSINLTKPGCEKDMTYSRSYIDANRRNYAYHLGIEQSRLDTEEGVNITSWMADIATAWNLTDVYGVSPQDYFLDRYSATSNQSVVDFLQTSVLPQSVLLNPSAANANRSDTPRFLVANTGLARFDLYAGNFTKNDQYIVSPFTNAFLVIKDVEYRYASQIIDRLSEGGYPFRRRSRTDDGAGEEMEEMYKGAIYESGEVDAIFSSWRAAQYELQLEEDGANHYLSELAQQDSAIDTDAKVIARAKDPHHNHDASADPTLGYVTKDSCSASVGNGPKGDDTIHRAIPYTQPPLYLSTAFYLQGQATTLAEGDDYDDNDNADARRKVDVIVIDFIQKAVLDILNLLQQDKIYTQEDATVWNSLSTQDIFRVFAQKEWS